MRQRLITTAILASLSLVPPPLFGEAGWSSYGYVAELTASNQLRYLVTLRVAKNPSGCRNSSVFYQDRSAFGSEQMFHLLLEALSSGKKIRVYVTGNCELNGYSEISAVSIAP